MMTKEERNNHWKGGRKKKGNIDLMNSKEEKDKIKKTRKKKRGITFTQTRTL